MKASRLNSVVLSIVVILLSYNVREVTSLMSFMKKQQRFPQRIDVPMIDSTFASPDVASAGITEELCIETANRMRRVFVPVSTSIHPNGKVGISYSFWPASNNKDTKKTIESNGNIPVVLVHGFDSSNLEFRRLGSRLAERGIDTYAVDLLGWGYTQLDGVATFSASAKVGALNSFLDTVVSTTSSNSRFCIAGASLGGAASIEVAVFNSNCEGLILIDAQGFVDGIGPMAMLPKPLAKLGAQVLQSVPLRSSANQMSYYNKESYATDEAVVIGRIHCMREGWVDALVSFMQSGGFAPSTLVAQVRVPTLLLWGRQDTILDGKEFTTKFLEALPNETTLRWIEECGHVPHLEQPDETANAIRNFITSLGNKSTGTLRTSSEKKRMNLDTASVLANGFGFAGISAIAASFASDWLPTF